MGVGGGDGVRVHAHDLGVGVAGLEFLLEPLGAHAHELEPAAAVGAHRRQGLGVAAVMAHQPPVGAVIGQVDRAPGTGGHLPAAAAQGHAAVAPAVEEEDGLLPPAEVLLQLLPEGGGETRGVALAQLRLHVRQGDLGQVVGVVALGEGEQVVLPDLRGVPALDGRGGRAQDQQPLVLGAAELGHLPGMVADHALGLVAALLLLVQDNEAGVRQGGEHRRPGADDHLGLAVPHPLPLVVPLPGGQAAVKDGHFTAEVGQENL